MVACAPCPWFEPPPLPPPPVVTQLSTNGPIQSGSIKRNGTLPIICGYNNRYQWMIMSPPEKNDTKIGNFGSIGYFLGHIL